MPRQSTKISRTCERCGRSFLAYRCDVGYGKAKFCSVDCRYLPLVDRFFSYVGTKTEDGCIPWIGYKGPQGYGRIIERGKTHLAHRLSYEIHVGPIPDGLQVLHNCPAGDNPSCCNPDHLFLGTNADNHKDKVAKGRQYKWERVWAAKLTPAIARKIRERYSKGGITHRQLAEEHGMAHCTIGSLLRGETWKDA
jgi:hypothetical protein